MSDADPRVVWEALAAGGWGPHGPLHDFYSRCPAHDGDGRSLHVTTSADGTILLHCFAYGCAPEEIVERIGLRMADLFPSDREYSGKLKTARREDFNGDLRTLVNILAAVQTLDLPVTVEIKLLECPCCESERPAVVLQPGHDLFTHCQRGCGVEAMTGALAERLRRAR